SRASGSRGPPAMLEVLSRLRPNRNRRRPSRTEQRLRLGARSLSDLIAPAAIETERAQLLLNRSHVRILALTEYPRYVHPNWLGNLVDFDQPLDLSLHVEPLESAAAIRSLTHKLVELQSSRMFDARRGNTESNERDV